MIPRNKPVQGDSSGYPVLQWANGKTTARFLGERFGPFVGFHIQRGKWTEIDKALEEISFPCIEIKHQRQGGAEIVKHWSLGEDVSLLPLCGGPVATTIKGCLQRKSDMIESGIGIAWPEGGRSQIAIIGFVGALWDIDISTPVQFGVKSRMSDFFLKALLDHNRVADIAEEVAKQKNPNAAISYADLWLPLTAGQEQDVGSGDTATIVPFVSAHPADVSGEYLRSMWRSESVAKAALKCWRNVQEWAAEFANKEAWVDRRTGEVGGH